LQPIQLFIHYQTERNNPDLPSKPAIIADFWPQQ